MPIAQEALYGNQNSIYPVAGINILAGYPVTTAGTVLTNNQWLILADTTLGAFTVKLIPTPFVGQTYQIVDNAPNGSFTANNLTIDGNGYQINGANTLVLAANYASRFIRFNGTRWIIVAQGAV
jgi:hypothetical protein